MGMDKRLLEILVCPVSHAPLREVTRTELAALNAAIARGEVHTAAGDAQTTPLDAALTTLDGATTYRVDDGIPVLLAEEGLVTSALSGAAGA